MSVSHAKCRDRMSGVNFESLECFLLDNLDWFKGKCAEPPKKNHGKTMENRWFPVDFPSNQSSDVHFSAKKCTNALQLDQLLLEFGHVWNASC